jgi:hypothetical protein
MTGSAGLGPDLMAQVARVAQVRRLLVVVDVDGSQASTRQASPSSPGAPMTSS